MTDLTEWDESHIADLELIGPDEIVNGGALIGICTTCRIDSACRWVDYIESGIAAHFTCRRCGQMWTTVYREVC